MIISTNAVIQQGTPIEIDSAHKMDAVLRLANIGNLYKYTGETTSDYVHGYIYGVFADEALDVCNV